MQVNQEHIQQTVAKIWSELLQIEDIGMDDDFFELGGTSLGLITVVMRMADRLVLPLDTSIVLEGATIAALTRGVLSQAAADPRPSTGTGETPAV
jgi:acyl carrier protein